MKAAEDRNVLQAVVFDNVRISDQYELFQQINGLLNRCAQAGNVAAQHMLAKTILVSSSQLLTMVPKRESSEFSSGGHSLADKASSSKIPKTDTLVASFMAHFVSDQASTSEASCQSLSHYELVRLFLHQCSPYDLAEMRPHLNHYIGYFTVPANEGCHILYDSINKMCNFGDRVKALEELEEIKDRLNDCIEVLKVFVKASREGNENPFLRKEENQPLEEATMKCGAVVLELKLKCKEVGVAFEAVFGAYANPEAFKKYCREVAARFEEHRTNAVLAFGHIFP